MLLSSTPSSSVTIASSVSFCLGSPLISIWPLSSVFVTSRSNSWETVDWSSLICSWTWLLPTCLLRGVPVNSMINWSPSFCGLVELNVNQSGCIKVTCRLSASGSLTFSSRVYSESSVAFDISVVTTLGASFIGLIVIDTLASFEHRDSSQTL